MHLDQLLDQMDLLTAFFGATGFCLSEHEDQLSQWRGYADNGAGVCIGFSKVFLQGLVTLLRSEKDLFTADLSEVIYDRAKQSSNIAGYLAAIETAVEEGALRPKYSSLLFSVSDDDKKKIEAAEKQLSVTFLAMFPHLYTLKNPAFREEGEWRLISYIYAVGKRIDTDFLSALEFYAKNDRIVPMRNIGMGDKYSGSIKQVILGPKNITPIKVVEAALKKFGFLDVDVRTSKASYR
jgi:hypothetical protein